MDTLTSDLGITDGVQVGFIDPLTGNPYTADQIAQLSTIGPLSTAQELGTVVPASGVVSVPTTSTASTLILWGAVTLILIWVIGKIARNS